MTDQLPFARRRRRAALAVIAVALVLLPVQVDSAPLISAEPTLKTLAAQSGRKMGTITTPDKLADPQVATTVAREFSMITPAKDLMWSKVHPQPDVYVFGPADAQIAFGEANGMEVIGHTLAWKDMLPNYVLEAEDDPDRLLQMLEDHVTEVVGHVRGRIDWWDVVNEPIGPRGGLLPHIWSNALGRTYIDKALRWAHAADPSAKLFINEYKTEGFSPKSNGLYRLARDLLADGVPLHAVGFQFHGRPKSIPAKDEIVANFQRFADLGLDILITELDIRVPMPPTPRSLEWQGRIYQRIMAACMTVPRCRAVTTWGTSDRYAWSERHFPGEGGSLPYDKLMREKPAYFGLAQAMGLRAPEAAAREAEQAASKEGGSQQEQSWRLSPDTAVADVFPLRRSGAYVVTVVARRTNGGPAPVVQVEVDGEPLGTIRVTSTVATAHHVVLTAEARNRWIRVRNIGESPVDVDRFGLGSSLPARQFVHRSGGAMQGDAWRADGRTVLRNPMLGASTGLSTLHVRARLAEPQSGQSLRVGLDSAVVASIPVEPGPWRWYSVPVVTSGGRDELELSLANGTGPDVLIDRVAVSPG